MAKQVTTLTTIYGYGLIFVTTGLMSSASAQVLEEIVVTATKREESLTNVPISISAVDTEKLIANGWNDATAVLEFIPNATFYQNGTATVKFNIRGVHSDGPNQALEAPVAIFTDGVYNPRPDFARTPLLDLESMEVQRGPQATYYGHNATAGSISFRSRRQSLEEADGFFVLEGSAESESKLDFAYGAPLSDSFGLRFSGAYRDDGGRIENIVQDRTEPAEETSIVRLSGVWLPNERSDVFFKLENYDTEITGEVREPITCGGAGNPTTAAPCRAFDPSANGSLVGQYDLALGVDDRIVEAADVLPNYTTMIFGMGATISSAITNVADAAFMSESSTYIDGTRAALEINHDFDSFTFTSITGIETGNRGFTRDADMTPIAGAFLTGVADYDYWTEELRLTSNTDGPVSWMVGGLIQGVENYARNQEVNNLAEPGPWGSDGEWIRSTHNQEDDIFGLFFDLSYDATDAFNVSFGGRYTDVEKTAIDSVDSAILNPNGTPGTFSEIINTSTGFVANLAGPPTFADGFADLGDGLYEGDSFDPYVSMQYAINDTANFYAIWSNAWKAGGFSNGPTPGYPFSILHPALPDAYEFEGEESENFEIGYKALLADGRLDLNISAFVTEFTNQHTVLPAFAFGPAPSPGVVFYTMGVDTEQQGVEIGGRFAASDNLLLTFAGALLDAELTDKGMMGLYDCLDCAPRELIQASDWSAAFGASYETLIGDSYELTLNTEMSFSDGYQVAYEGVFEDQAVGDQLLGWQDSWESINVRAALRPVNGNWEVSLFGRNITDDRRTYDYAPDGGASLYYVTRPKGSDWGLAYRYNF